MNMYDVLLAKKISGGEGGGITPTGTLEITENGQHDVTAVAVANVNVQAGGGDDLFAQLVGGTIVDAVIPYGVTEIIGSTFYNRTHLKTVDIPATVTELGARLFQGASALESVTIRAVNPPTATSFPFSNVNSNAIVYVPSQSVEVYKETSGYTAIKDRIQAIPE